MVKPRFMLKYLLFILFFLPLFPLLSQEVAAVFPGLTPGLPYNGSVPLSGEEGAYATFLVDVPEEAFGLRLSLSRVAADLDLFIRYGKEIEDYSEVDGSSELEDYNEEFFLTRYSDAPLKTGTYYVDVAYQLEETPVTDGESLTEIPFQITAEILPFWITERLVPGKKVQSSLSPATGMARFFTVLVPPGADTLRIDLWDSPGDLDIFVKRGGPAPGLYEADYIAESSLSRESLLISSRSYPPLEPDLYYITVIDQIIEDQEEDFTLIAVFDDAPPEELLDIAMIPVRSSPLERALQGVVEITSQSGKGSGVLISPRGYILSNWHVVKGLTGEPDESPVIALSLQFDNPPEEMFRARVLRYDKKLDLALLIVESGLYGQPLPEGYRFPYVPLGRDEGLRIGDEIHIVGFPGTGGTGSRAPVTYSRGVLSGFDKTNFGRLLKTDAQIHRGNSGGAALNSEFLLIGLPTAIVQESSGHLGFIHSLSMIPPEWFEDVIF